MVYKRFSLAEFSNNRLSSQKDAALTAYIIGNSAEIDAGKKRGAVVICPGGGYRFTSQREAEPVALRLLSHDLNVFVLDYSTFPEMYPQQLFELSYAVKFIKDHAEKWNIDQNNISLMGFSAGGHLAATLGVKWNDRPVFAPLGLEAKDIKPDKLVLCYPVITSEERYINKGSFENLTGQKEEERDKLSLENWVSGATPPTFLWHTADDRSVDVMNSLLFANALRRQNLPFELHIFQSGVHGLSLADESTAKKGQKQWLNQDVAQWFPLCINWLKK